ncbi:MAG: ATP-binding protein [Anaerolineae bacterium]|nr:ATP-binding protein [Anaerolineae bacterium]MCC7188239.1 ATP-binding protein [Anaerolineales bacterium]
MLYSRLIANNLVSDCFQGRVIILVGARQTGKTTLAQMALERLDGRKVRFINGDDPIDREALNDKSLESLTRMVGDAEVLFVDEGQKIKTIGQTLKLLVDHYGAQRQVIVTGSSTINLLDSTQEPLTGRKFVYNLYPLALSEIVPDADVLEIQKKWTDLLVYGSYPRVIQQDSYESKAREVREIAASYLYRDILELQQVRNPEALNKLVQALALQIGSEVSYAELAQTIGMDRISVERYVQLLERSFVIFRLPPYSGNKRRTLSKLRKIYFWDVGVRNAVIRNFNPLDSRADGGALFENWMIAERMKMNEYRRSLSSSYFWRTYDGSEIDYIEETNQNLQGFEFKLKFSKTNRSFEKAGIPVTVMDAERIVEFLYG